MAVPINGKTIETPELDKERKAREERHSEDLGLFLDWYRDNLPNMKHKSVLQVLYEYFEIDYQEAERERRLLLAALNK